MTKKTPGPIRASELMAQLASDPEYQARMAEKRRRMDEARVERRLAEKPLVEELRSAGFDVDTSWDLVQTSEPYPDALPILIDHLPRGYPSKVREGIARALAVRDPSIRDAWPRLLSIYRREPPGVVRHAMALIFANSATDDDFDIILGLLSDERLGESRILLVQYLEKHARAMPRAQKALMALGDDPQLHLEVQDALKRNRRREKERLRARERRAAKRREKEAAKRREKDAAKRRGDRNAGED